MGRLFWKIFVGFWLTLLLAGMVVGAAVWQYNKSRIEQLEVLVDGPRAEMIISWTAKLLQLGGVPALHEIMERRDEHHERPFPVLIIDARDQDALGRPVPEMVISKAREVENDTQKNGIRTVTTPQGEQFLLFIPRRDLPFMHASRLLPKHFPLAPLLTFLLASLLFSACLAWYITRPIRKLTDATRQFAQGRLDTRVMPEMGKRRDEITELAQEFDVMAEQIQQLIAAQKRLLNDVSHELRSPLARLQVAVEMSRQQPQKLDELMQRIEKESQRLDELVGELLTLSRLEANIDHRQQDCFDINGLLCAIVDDAQFEAKNQHKQVVYQPNRELLVSGSMELLRRAIENVVRNAVFYTPQNTQVQIHLQQLDNELLIEVCDQGKGVNEQKLTELFQPFLRISENEQNVSIPGYGLGLAIARRALEIHHGSIRAYNATQGGLCIEMRLPMMRVAL